MRELLIAAGGVGVVAAAAALWLESRRRIGRRCFAGLVALAVALERVFVPRLGRDCDRSHRTFAAYLGIRHCTRRPHRGALISRIAGFAGRARLTSSLGSDPCPLRISRFPRRGSCPAAAGARYQGGTDADPLPHRFCRSRRVRPRHPAIAVLCAALCRFAATGDGAAGDLFADAAVHRSLMGKAQRSRRQAAGADGQHGRLGARLSLDRQRDGAVDAVRGARLGRRLRRQHCCSPGLYRRYHQTGGAGQGDGPDRRGIRIGLYHRPGARRAAGGS